MLRITGAGHKTASPMVLTQAQRAAVDRALTGYLKHFEDAWRLGSIEDYPLFPAGRLVKGRSKLVSDAKPLTRAAALDMFHHLERAAGVAAVKGRGWYGVRRIAADLAEDIEPDERVLNSITGHRDSATRRGVYQQNERPEVLSKAATTRERIRGLISISDLDSVPQTVPQKQTAAIESPRRSVQPIAIMSFTAERATGLEPATSSLGSWHSTN